MEIIDYSCRECEPNLTYYYDLELIRNIIDSNYITIVKYDDYCFNCSIKLYNKLAKRGFHIEVVVKLNEKCELHISSGNLKAYYVLDNKKIYLQQNTGTTRILTEEEFLREIKDGTVMHFCYAEKNSLCKQHDNEFYKNIVQKITSMGFEIQDLVFENHYYMSIIKKLPMTKPARKCNHNN